MQSFRKLLSSRCPQAFLGLISFHSLAYKAKRGGLQSTCDKRREYHFTARYTYITPPVALTGRDDTNQYSTYSKLGQVTPFLTPILCTKPGPLRQKYMSLLGHPIFPVHQNHVNSSTAHLNFKSHYIKDFHKQE